MSFHQHHAPLDGVVEGEHATTAQCFRQEHTHPERIQEKRPDKPQMRTIL